MNWLETLQTSRAWLPVRAVEFSLVYSREKFDNRDIFENLEKSFFSAKQKATSSKLGTYVGHNVKYVPVNLQPSGSIFTARKKLKPLPFPIQLLRERIMKRLETLHTTRA